MINFSKVSNFMRTGKIKTKNKYRLYQFNAIRLQLLKWLKKVFVKFYKIVLCKWAICSHSDVKYFRKSLVETELSLNHLSEPQQACNCQNNARVLEH